MARVHKLRNEHTFENLYQDNVSRIRSHVALESVSLPGTHPESPPVSQATSSMKRIESQICCCEVSVTGTSGTTSGLGICFFAFRVPLVHLEDQKIAEHTAAVYHADLTTVDSTGVGKRREEKRREEKGREEKRREEKRREHMDSRS